MKPNNETYWLETLQDLLQLHPDQLERWFEDFKLVHKFAYEKVNSKTKLRAGFITSKVIMRRLEWTDDGKNEGTIRERKINVGETND
nr:MAG TPA: hypothetical protein [Caudoviricetes sp.]